MAEYYVSSESFWENERKKHEMVGRGIDVLSSLDSSLIMAFRELESDKYGLMSRSSYSSLSKSIEKCREKNDDLTNYARRIHGILEEKEFDFFKGLNGVFEELSLLDIQDYKTENTLNITETVMLPNADIYTPGGTMYMNEEVKKGKINITDIQTKTDVLGMQKQFEAYLKENGKKNTDVKKLKEDFYKGALRTQFEHEVYSSGFWKGLSSTLDYVPLVGGVKNTIEACVGYSMTGEKLTTGERLLVGGLGVASVIIDVFTFGLGTGLIQGGKVVGKQVTKGMMKQVGKYAVMDITTSVVVGWTSNYASEKLRDMGLSSEEIFMVHLVASLSVMGYSKYKTKKVNINTSDKKAAWKLPILKRTPYEFMNDTVEHIFKGVVKNAGTADVSASGWHYLGKINPPGNKIIQVINEADEFGTIIAKVDIDGVAKKGFSSFFSNKYTPDEVVNMIMEAHMNKKLVPNTKGCYRGVANNGMIIEMYLYRNVDGSNIADIITAYPVHTSTLK